MLSTIKLAFKFLDPSALTTLYKSFVRPLLEYCSVSWCPYYVRDIDALERVQRRFTKILPIHRCLSYDDRLEKYNLSSLYARRIKFDLICVFKIIHGLIDIQPQSFFDFDNDSRTRGHRHKIKHPRFYLDIRKHWFASRIISLWNDLPSECVEAANVISFKNKVTNYLLSKDIK